MPKRRKATEILNHLNVQEMDAEEASYVEDLSDVPDMSMSPEKKYNKGMAAQYVSEPMALHNSYDRSNINRN